MKITVFTGNQLRHVSLIKDLSGIADEVFAVQECGSVFRKSETMQEYFKHVNKAEKEVFGSLSFSPNNVKSLSISIGDLNKLDFKTLNPALHSDYYVVFGSSFIKGKLIDFLVKNKAVNIHMGVSPQYRGSSCNFWALYDNKPEYVGATIHLLSKGLDSGEILFHSFPDKQMNPFVFGMDAVKVAHKDLINFLKREEIKDFVPIPQDKSLEIRYSRKEDFTDEIAKDYLKKIYKINEKRSSG